MRYTTPITTLAVNSSGERQLEAHHLDDNFAAQDNAINAITRALFAAGGVAKAGTVTLTGLNLRVQDRVGVTLDVSAALHVTDLTLDLTTLPAGKGTVVMTTNPVTVNRTYTDIVTQENLTDTMTVRLGRLYVMGAGGAGVALDAGGYPVAPANTVPVAHVTRTAGGATLDEVLNPAIQVNSSVTGPAGADGADGTDGADGVSVTGAEINGSGHLILTLSDATTIDAGEVSGGGGDSSLPAPGTAGNVLTSDGAAWVSAPAPSGGEGGGAAYLYTGYASVESPPLLAMTDEMNANTFGASMDLRYTAAQAGSMQAVTLRLRGYDPSNDARIDVHRITDGTWTAGAGTLVGSLPLNALGTSMVTRTLSLPSAVTFASNDRLVLRLVPVSAALLMVDATQNGQALPYLLPNGVLSYAGGQSSSGNNDAIGTRVPNVAWQSQVSKTTVGPSISAGATGLRPVNPQAGDQHYDTTLGKPVWWSGSAWKDASGTNA